VTFDEAGFRLVPVYKKVWFFKGEKPKGVFFWSNKKINIIGALIDGKEFFYEWHTSLNSVTFYFFLNNFLKKYPHQKFVFILDNAGYHKTSPIQDIFGKNKDRIKVEFLPTYSPELNPTETCWKIIRHDVTNSTYFQTIENMQEAIETFLDKNIFRLNVSNYLCP